VAQIICVLCNAFGGPKPRFWGGEPHGYAEFMASVDALVIGRKTFETVVVYDKWPYGDKRVVVLSRRAMDLGAVKGGVVEQMAGTPAEIIAKLAAGGEGIPLFGPLPHDVRLHHVATRHYPSGLVQSEYNIAAMVPFARDVR
jgi:hypothetical protein